MVRVKICCIASIGEARTAIAHGAAALGLVSRMPSGPGVIDDRLIGEVIRAAPPGVSTFLLTSAIDAAPLIAQATRLAPSALQLVDAVSGPAVYQALRAALPALKLVQVIHVRDESAVAAALAAAVHVDALLLDSGNPAADMKELGGTGRIHDWRLSRRIVDTARVPVFLAGGLDAANVSEAIAAVRPFGVDACSGLRRDGALEPARLARFMAAISMTA